MPVADKPLVSPEEPKPGIPLKKSTLAVIVVGLFVLAFVSALILQGSGPAQQPGVGTPNASSKLQQIGSPNTIAEEERLARATVAPSATTPPATTPPMAATAQQSPLPPEVRRTDNTAALFDTTLPAGGGRNGDRALSDQELEFQAKARISPAVVADFTTDQQAGRSAPTGTPTVREAHGGQWQAPNQARAPSEDVQATIDAAMAAMRTNQNANEPRASWLEEYAQRGTGGRNVLTSYRAQEPYILHQGSVIPAVLGRQINSDLPGEISAFTTVNVYDSLGRGHLLIPKGSRLVGAYDAEIRVGQSRVLFAFERLILPNGVSFDLPAAKGSDLSGAAGLAGRVNNHFFRMFSSSLLIALLADNTQRPANVVQNDTTTPADAAGQVLVDVSRSILERNRTIQPTITVAQGARLNVQVVQDMVFPGAYRARP